MTRRGFRWLSFFLLTLLIFAPKYTNSQSTVQSRASNTCYESNSCTLATPTAFAQDQPATFVLRLRSSQRENLTFASAFFTLVDQFTQFTISSEAITNITDNFTGLNEYLMVGLELYSKGKMYRITYTNNTQILDPCPTSNSTSSTNTTTPGASPSPSPSTASPSPSPAVDPENTNPSPTPTPSPSASPSGTISSSNSSSSNGVYTDGNNTYVDGINCTTKSDYFLQGYLPMIRFTDKIAVSFRTAIVALDQGVVTGFYWDSSICIACPTTCLESACATSNSTPAVTIYVGWTGTAANNRMCSSASLSLNRLQGIGFW